MPTPVRYKARFLKQKVSTGTPSPIALQGAMDSIRIDRLGHQGNGIATDGSFIPFTLPGEEVEATPPHSRLTDSPDRIAPVCPHFGTCGGCALQHASDTFLAGWKEDVVRRALAARRIEAPFRPTFTTPPATRRRATFTGRRTKKTVQIGFHARRSDQIVPIAQCAVVLPEMLQVFPALQEITRAGASRKGALRLQVTATGAGWDLAVGGGKPLDTALRTTLAAIVAKHDLARLTWEDEVVAMARPPVVQMGRAQVVLPPGALLQASEAAEQIMVAVVREILGGATTIVDLFAGCGTFALPLAEEAEVHAVESDTAMLSALDRGWRGAGGLRLVTTERRDLFRRPLLPLDLKRFDAAVIDPPRAGAEAQMQELATSHIARIAAVSCNPVTFARDAEILIGAGFKLDWVQVIDQFRWSPHVELVAQLSR